MKLRFDVGPAVAPGRTKNQALAWAAASLLTPTALAAWAVAIWKLASDLGIAGTFGFRAGLFSHWQFWIACALALTTAAVRLNRYGRAPKRESVTR